MRAVVFQGPEEPMTVEEIDRPSCDDDGVIVETEACGVCRSDWHAWKGDWDWIGLTMTPGLVFGHEPCGTVVEVGDNVEDISENDRITTPFNMSDGTCRHCMSGRANICEHSVPMGFLQFQPGAYAEEFPVRVADQNAIAVPDGLDAVDIAGLGCRFSTAFHGIAHRVDVEPGDTVAVHGCGGVGLSAIMTATALGGRVIAVDLDERSLEMAQEIGAEETINVTEVEDVPQTVKSFTPNNRGVEVSVDALGIADTCRNSVDSLCKGGQHLQIGLTTSEEGGKVSLPVDTMVIDEQEFYGSYGMPPHEYDEIFSMMEAGSIDPGTVVSETISLDAVPDTVASMGDYDTVGIPVCNEF